MILPKIASLTMNELIYDGITINHCTFDDKLKEKTINDIFKKKLINILVIRILMMKDIIDLLKRDVILLN